MAKQTFTVGQVLTAAQMTSLQQTAMGGGSTTAKTASYVLVGADAGTVVQMNAAGATTITVNTALFAAGDTVQIQNVGAGVCTVTAGTATVNTSSTLALAQYDSGDLYFNTTSAAFFFAADAADGLPNVLTTTGDIIYSSSGSTAARLGIGSSAQVLSVSSGLPAWTTASAGGMTLISTTSLTGASVTLSSIPGTYNNLMIVIRNYLPATDAASLYLRFNADATANRHSSTISSDLYGGGQGFSVTSSYGSNSADNATSQGLALVDIYDYTNTTTWKMLRFVGLTNNETTTTNLNLRVGFGMYNQTGAVTSFELFPSSGNFTSGSALLYGVK